MSSSATSTGGATPPKHVNPFYIESAAPQQQHHHQEWEGDFEYGDNGEADYYDNHHHHPHDRRQHDEEEEEVELLDSAIHIAAAPHLQRHRQNLRKNRHRHVFPHRPRLSSGACLAVSSVFLIFLALLLRSSSPSSSSKETTTTPSKQSTTADGSTATSAAAATTANRAAAIEQLIVLGERHSGVDWLMEHLQDCFLDQEDSNNNNGISIRRGLNRDSFFFQRTTADTKSELTGPTLFVVSMRNPYFWVDDMRRFPQYMPAHSMYHHQNNDNDNTSTEWHDFVTKEWSLLPKGQRPANDTNAQWPCQFGFALYEVVTCQPIRAHNNNNNNSDTNNMDTNPVYEMNVSYFTTISTHDDDDDDYHNNNHPNNQAVASSSQLPPGMLWPPQPFENILALRAAKIHHWMTVLPHIYRRHTSPTPHNSTTTTTTATSPHSALPVVVTVHYPGDDDDNNNNKEQSLRDQALQKAVQDIAGLTGWQPHCSNTKSASSGSSQSANTNTSTSPTTSASSLNQDYIQWMNEHVDWTAEALVHYAIHDLES